MKAIQEKDKQEFVLKDGTLFTIEQLMEATGWPRYKLGVFCRENGIQPKDSNWCKKTVHGEPPLKAEKKEYKRAPAVYGNLPSPLGIYSEMK